MSCLYPKLADIQARGDGSPFPIVHSMLARTGIIRRILNIPSPQGGPICVQSHAVRAMTIKRLELLESAAGRIVFIHSPLSCAQNDVQPSQRWHEWTG